MKKVLLDLNPMKTIEQLHEYLKFELEFEDCYGENLDALYDQLTSITEDTCVGVFCPNEEDDISPYLRRVRRVFRDAEAENEHLLVIFSEMEENYDTE